MPISGLVTWWRTCIIGRPCRACRLGRVSRSRARPAIRSAMSMGSRAAGTAHGRRRPAPGPGRPVVLDRPVDRRAGRAAPSGRSVQIRASEDEAQYLAFHDTLTGLPNRALFEERLKRWRRSRGAGGSSRCSTSTSTASRTSTTRSAIRRATNWSGRPPRRLERSLARGRHRRAARRRRIRHHPVRHQGSERRRGSERATARRDQPAVRASWAIRCSSAQASASRCRPDPAPIRPTCCARPTSRSTRRRRTAGAATQVFAGDMDDYPARKRVIERDLRERSRRRRASGSTTSRSIAADCRPCSAPKRWSAGSIPFTGRCRRGMFVAHRRRARHDRPARRLGAARGAALRRDDPICPGSPSTSRRCSCATWSLRRRSSTSRKPGCRPARLQLEITESVLLETARRRKSMLASCAPPASASRSTISAPATRRSATCTATRSTSSRSTAPS